MDQTLFPTYLQHIVFAVVGNCNDYFHGCFGQIEKKIVRLIIPNDGDSEQSLLDFFKLLVGRTYAEVGYLLQTVGLIGLTSAASYQLQDFGYLCDAARVIFGHFRIKNSLVLLLDILDLLLNPFNKLVHVVNFALDQIVSLYIGADLLGISAQPI